jgi:hypothetical protein
MTDIDKFMKALIETDKKLRPYAIICNPVMGDVIKAAVNGDCVVKTTPACPEDTCYAINRRDFDKYCKEGFYSIQDFPLGASIPKPQGQIVPDLLQGWIYENNKQKALNAERHDSSDEE